MKSNELEKSIWIIQKAKILKKYSFLSEDDLTFRDGNKDAMLQELQIKLCLSKADLDRFLAK